MMTINRIRPWRRLAETVQAVVIIGLPFVKIRGESALRFDVPSLQLHFFGVSLWMEEFFIVLVACLFLALLIIFVTLLLGRVWCGWACPQTVISDLTGFVDRAGKKGLLNKIAAYSMTLLISIIIAANLIWYFVSPYEFISRVFAGSLGSVISGFWLVLTGLLFLNFVFLRQNFCATVCPYAKLQSTMFDKKTLTVAFDPRRKAECIECMACVKSCPVGIDIREGLSAACIHCAECVDSCAAMMKPRRKKSLVGYFFGQPGEMGRITRPNVILFGAVTFIFLAFFIYLLAVRVPVDMTVLPNHAFQPRVAADGGMLNSYIISVRNRGRQDEELRIKVAGSAGRVKITPDRPISVKAGETKKVSVYINIKHQSLNMAEQDIEIIIESISSDNVQVSGNAVFIIPEDR